MPEHKLGPIRLAEGVRATHALVFLYAAFIGITLNTYINFIQPYVLTEQLHIPEAEQGAVTGNIVFDAGASICIGLILAVTAAWLAYEAKGLLIGESAAPETVAAINDIVMADDRVLAVNELITLHMGPSDIIVTLSVDFVDGIDSSVLEGAVTELNRSIKGLNPNIRRVFIEAERAGDHLPSVVPAPPRTTAG